MPSNTPILLANKSSLDAIQRAVDAQGRELQSLRRKITQLESTNEPTYGGPSQTIAIVKNSSGTDRSQFEILGVDTTIWTGINFSLPLTGIVPTTASHTGRFAVCQEAIPSGKTGRCCVAGVTQAKVAIGSANDGFADVTDNDATKLTSSATSGSAQVLYNGGGTGTQTAIIRLGPPPSTGTGWPYAWLNKGSGTVGVSSHIGWGGTGTNNPNSLVTIQSNTDEVAINTTGTYRLTCHASIERESGSDTIGWQIGLKLKLNGSNDTRPGGSGDFLSESRLTPGTAPAAINRQVGWAFSFVVELAYTAGDEIEVAIFGCGTTPTIWYASLLIEKVA